MDEARLWGGLGILLALVGLAVIAPDVLGAAAESGLASPMVLYGIGVVVAAVVTVVVIGPSIATR